MQNFKLLALTSVIIATSNAIASNYETIGKTFCSDQDIASDVGYDFDKKSEKTIKICIAKSDGAYLVTEDSFIYGKNEYLIDGLEEADYNS